MERIDIERKYKWDLTVIYADENGEIRTLATDGFNKYIK